MSSSRKATGQLLGGFHTLQRGQREFSATTGRGRSHKATGGWLGGTLRGLIGAASHCYLLEQLPSTPNPASLHAQRSAGRQPQGP